jgi:transposase
MKPTDVATAAAYTLRRLAQRILDLTDVITAHAPQLLRPVGVGADSAAALLIAAGDNPGRLASEASFAALCGVSPIERSSGKTQRHRLNRGGTATPTPPSTASC